MIGLRYQPSFAATLFQIHQTPLFRHHIVSGEFFKSQAKFWNHKAHQTIIMIIVKGQEILCLLLSPVLSKAPLQPQMATASTNADTQSPSNHEIQSTPLIAFISEPPIIVSDITEMFAQPKTISTLANQASSSTRMAKKKSTVVVTVMCLCSPWHIVRMCGPLVLAWEPICLHQLKNGLKGGK